jgi:hypothetical protein
MIAERPLADPKTELQEPTDPAGQRTSLCLHGVPVPSRVLGFSVAWHRSVRTEVAPVDPPKLVTPQRRSTDGSTSTAAA